MADREKEYDTSQKQTSLVPAAGSVDSATKPKGEVKGRAKGKTKPKRRS